MRHWIALIVGLGVGAVGAVLFMQSQPPDEGSARAAADAALADLQRAERRIAALEAENGRRGSREGSTFSDRARAIAQDYRDGKPVDLDDIFRTMQPVMRDLAPVFDRMRVRDQKRHFDRLAGELTRRYDLNAGQQQALQDWFARKAEENAARFGALVRSDDTRFEDMIRASRDEYADEGLDELMANLLDGETSERFREDRMMERVERVQAEADRNVHRLDAVVSLDEEQKDRVFALMARGARDFDPAMRFDGLDEADAGPLAPGGSREEALLEVLTPDQQLMLDEHRQRRREEAERELAEIGLSLPEDWDLFDQDDF